MSSKENEDAPAKAGVGAMFAAAVGELASSVMDDANRLVHNVVVAARTRNEPIALSETRNAACASCGKTSLLPASVSRQCSMCSLYFCGTCLPLEHRLPHDLTVRSLPLGGGRAGGLNGPSDAVGGSAVITPRTFTSTFACSKCLAANCGLDVAVYAKAAANADTTADTPFDDSSHFNQAEATKVAKLCQAGYEKESAISSEVLAPLGMKLVGVVSIPHDTSCCIVACDDTCVYLAFRGTCTVSNIMTDVDAVAVTLQEPFHTVSKLRVHAGFLKSYLSLRFSLLKTLQHLRVARGDGVPPRQLVITGHSLGGAQATLAAWDIACWQAWAGSETVSKMRLITFGSPRTGNREFAAAFNTLLARAVTFRVGNIGDPVPHVPTSSWMYTYTHVNTLVVPLVKQRHAAAADTGTDAGAGAGVGAGAGSSVAGIAAPSEGVASDDFVCVVNPSKAQRAVPMRLRLIGLAQHTHYLGAVFPSNPLQLTNE